MYISFKYKDGSNPYLSTNNDNLFKMILKYNLTQIGANSFCVWDAKKPYKKTYKARRAILRAFAQDWQFRLDKWTRTASYEDLIEWGGFFEEYGKKYGLLREFRENGII